MQRALIHPVGVLLQPGRAGASTVTKWAGSAAWKRRLTLSAVVAEALSTQRQHQAREQFLKEALSGVAEDEIERRTAEAYRDADQASRAPPGGCSNHIASKRRGGEALAKVSGATAVDATVMASAAQRGDRVFISDPMEMRSASRVPGGRPHLRPRRSSAQ